METLIPVNTVTKVYSTCCSECIDCHLNLFCLLIIICNHCMENDLP